MDSYKEIIFTNSELKDSLTYLMEVDDVESDVADLTDRLEDLSDVHPHLLKEIKEFFETYKKLEPNKWVKFKAWKNAEEAERIISYAINLYKEKFI